MLLKNYVNSFNEQINTCLPWYTQMLQQLQQGVSAYKVFNTFEIISCIVYAELNKESGKYKFSNYKEVCY